MKIYRVEKSIREIEIDDDKLLNYIKETPEYEDDEDIQNSKTLEELIDICDGLGEFEAEIEDYYNNSNYIPERYLNGRICFFDNSSDAHDFFSFGEGN